MNWILIRFSGDSYAHPNVRLIPMWSKEIFQWQIHAYRVRHSVPSRFKLKDSYTATCNHILIMHIFITYVSSHCSHHYRLLDIEHICCAVYSSYHQSAHSLVKKLVLGIVSESTEHACSRTCWEHWDHSEWARWNVCSLWVHRAYTPGCQPQNMSPSPFPRHPGLEWLGFSQAAGCL